MPDPTIDHINLLVGIPLGYLYPSDARRVRHVSRRQRIAAANQGYFFLAPYATHQAPIRLTIDPGGLIRAADKGRPPCPPSDRRPVSIQKCPPPRRSLSVAMRGSNPAMPRVLNERGQFERKRHGMDLPVGIFTRQDSQLSVADSRQAVGKRRNNGRVFKIEPHIKRGPHVHILIFSPSPARTHAPG